MMFEHIMRLSKNRQDLEGGALCGPAEPPNVLGYFLCLFVAILFCKRCISGW
jgi:hypothetical protein